VTRAAAIAAAFLCALASAGASAAPETVSFGIAEEGGHATLAVQHVSGPVTLDVRGIRFTASPHGGDSSGAVPIDVDVGAPVLAASSSPRENVPVAWRVYRYHAALAFRSRPARPGMYDVRAIAPDGFARAEDGHTLPVSGGTTTVYFPDERDGDRGLAAVRQRFGAGVFYGYGGIVVGCPPAWQNGYRAWVPIHIRSIVREHDRVLRLGTGVIRAWYNAGFSFLTLDPIALAIDVPPANASTSQGGSAQPPLLPCPALRVADPWHADVLISPAKPPPDAIVESGRVSLGMTREQLRWTHGYPPQWGDAPAVDRAAVWSYDLPAPFAWSVTFANDRVVKFDGPADMR
jgi:hypothetical protein